MNIKIKRIQSANSINTFKQCPRKYFYQYVLALPTGENYHTIRGNIVHSSLEHFFTINLTPFDEKNYEKQLKVAMQEILLFYWKTENERFVKIGVPQEKVHELFQESLQMLTSWVELFCRKIKETKKPFKDAFAFLTPIAEQHFLSEKYGVQGYIDAIEIQDGKIRIMDYKTSSKNEISNEYLLQLAIYALLYYEKYNKLPDEAGLYLLKHGEKTINVDEKLLDLARKDIDMIHKHTQSEDIKDYPKQQSPLCKWSTGKCDFHDICFNQKKISEN